MTTLPRPVCPTLFTPVFATKQRRCNANDFAKPISVSALLTSALCCLPSGHSYRHSSRSGDTRPIDQNTAFQKRRSGESCNARRTQGGRVSSSCALDVFVHASVTKTISPSRWRLVHSCRPAVATVQGPTAPSHIYGLDRVDIPHRKWRNLEPTQRGRGLNADANILTFYSTFAGFTGFRSQRAQVTHRSNL